jgi:transcriptional regulator with XRE-family HTH domain
MRVTGHGLAEAGVEGAEGAEVGGESHFAAELKAHRAAKGWTQVELGRQIGYSGSFVSDVERDERSPSLDFAQRCDEAFELPKTFERIHAEMQKTAFPPFFAPIVPSEREAERIHGWELGAVTGLLQTDRYARSVIQARSPGDDDESIERIVAARMEARRSCPGTTP